MAEHQPPARPGMVNRIVIPDRLAAVGRVLYGPRWQSVLVADLHVPYRTMRRWMGGDRTIPRRIGTELHALLRQRRSEIHGLLA